MAVFGIAMIVSVLNGQKPEPTSDSIKLKAIMNDLNTGLMTQGKEFLQTFMCKAFYHG
jgi:hypothetical protein